MAIMGRPPIENPKGHTVSFRMDDEQYLRLKEYSLRYDVTLTQVIQKAVDSFIDNGKNPGSVSSFPASERSNNGSKKRQQGKSVKKGGNLSKK